MSASPRSCQIQYLVVLLDIEGTAEIIYLWLHYLRKYFSMFYH